MGLFSKKKELDLYAPITGELIDITDVKDQVFSQKILGDGVAIEPKEGVLYAPFDCEVVQLFHTLHAIGLKTKDVEILVHIGMDTVELNGEGFKGFVNEGDHVKKGQKLIEFDIDYIKSKGKEATTPIVITNMDIVKSLDKSKAKDIVANQDIAVKINL
ncbi:PTS sugar transporter subunit IIA [Fenollaria sporofastidiosus]|uniref:PTS sugar transporter subunit IIA n=1 Tax=Fenollaria sporofastidiosus TaxID=2811778 RepID=UPI001C004622|nr:PTS glucose transporter subunit IIA [Fenollaria sporofastidiosus]